MYLKDKKMEKKTKTYLLSELIGCGEEMAGVLKEIKEGSGDYLTITFAGVIYRYDKDGVRVQGAKDGRHIYADEARVIAKVIDQTLKARRPPLEAHREKISSKKGKITPKKKKTLKKA